MVNAEGPPHVKVAMKPLCNIFTPVRTGRDLVTGAVEHIFFGASAL